MNSDKNTGLSTEAAASVATSVADSVATLGGGCFWCLEAALNQLAGVESVVSGYAGGPAQNPDYHSVCTGRSGHAEVV